jgi:hypothetical protein
MAGGARNVVGHDHALARAKVAGAFTRRRHLADDLVPEHGRTRSGSAELG